MRAVSPPPGRPSSAVPEPSGADRAELLERLQDSVFSLLASVAEASVPVLELVVPLVEQAFVAVANEQRANLVAARRAASGGEGGRSVTASVPTVSPAGSPLGEEDNAFCPEHVASRSRSRSRSPCSVSSWQLRDVSEVRGSRAESPASGRTASGDEGRERHAKRRRRSRQGDSEGAEGASRKVEE